MATSALQVFVSVVSLLYLGVHVNAKVEHYAVQFLSHDTLIREEVEVDIENGTEVFRVPQQKDMEPMDVMNDFFAGLTVYRFPSTQVCHVLKLDSDLPSPQKLKVGLDQAANQPQKPDESEKATTMKRETTVRVVEFASPLDLPQRILDFCGSFSIYNVEVTSLHVNDRSIQVPAGSRRKKRQLFFPPACSTSDKNTVQLCLDLYGPAGYYWLTKNMNRNSNYNYYYIIKCDKDNFGHKCSNHVRVYRYYCYKFYC